MADQIVYDRVWLNDYIDQLMKYEDYVNRMKDQLNQVRENIMPDQIELYLSLIREVDQVEYNFQIMRHTLEQFISYAESCAFELKKFSSWN